MAPTADAPGDHRRTGRETLLPQMLAIRMLMHDDPNLIDVGRQGHFEIRLARRTREAKPDAREQWMRSEYLL